MSAHPLVSHGVTVELAGSTPHEPPRERLEFADLAAAHTFLAPIAADPFAFPELRRIAVELAPGAPLREVDEITGRVAAALVSRRIAFVRVEAVHLAAAVYVPEKQPEAGDSAGEGAELQWIEARLVDEDGVGVSGQRCVIVAADGQRHQIYTDSLGTTRLNQIPAGSCKIQYPDLDPAALPKSEAANPTRAEMRDRFTAHELVVGVTRSTSEVHQLRLLNLSIRVRLAIDPNDARSRDDQFILHAVKGSAAQKIVKTIKDDRVPGDASVDLIYEHLWRDHRYTLEVDPGAEGEPYHVFHDTPLQQLLTH